MQDEATPQELDAIRQVILSGVAGDFSDVVNAVYERYRLRVGAGLVEQVYRQMQEDERAEALSAAKATHRPHPPRDVDSGEETLQKVLRFVRDLGGFAEARAALDAVEKKLKELI